MTTPDGIYPEMSNKAYHADSSIGSTHLKCLASENRAGYYWRYLDEMNPDKGKSTAAMDLGSLAHLLLLEPARYVDEYLVGTFTQETKAGNVKKAAKDEHNASGDPRNLISDKSLDTARKMIEIARNDKLASSLLTGGIAECSYFVTDPRTGIRMKTKPDYYNEGTGTLIDYKTARITWGLDDFVSTFIRRAFYPLGYGLQMAHYKEVLEQAGKEVNEVLLIVQSTTPPYCVEVAELTYPHLAAGDNSRLQALDILAECRKTGEYPSNDGKIKELPSPRIIDND